MQEDNRKKGKVGEKEAADYLAGKGYQIIKKNFHFGKHGEIDIICKYGDVLVFVEVKARESYEYGDPLLSITPRKQKSWQRAAEGYLYVNKINDVECRFDVITIDMRKTPHAIEHLENALSPF